MYKILRGGEVTALRTLGNMDLHVTTQPSQKYDSYLVAQDDRCYSSYRVHITTIRKKERGMKVS